MTTNKLPSNTIPDQLQSFVGKTIQFRGQIRQVTGWRREDTHALLSTDKGFLQLPYQYVHEVEIVEKEATPAPIVAAPEVHEPVLVPPTPPQSEGTTAVTITAQPPLTASAEVARPDNGLLFGELSSIGMESLRMLKDGKMKHEQAELVFRGIDTMVKVGMLQVRGMEVMKALDRKTDPQKEARENG